MLPQRFAENDGSILPDIAFVISKRPAQLGCHPDESEKRGRDIHRVNALGSPIDVKTRIARIEERLFLEGRHVTQTIEVVRCRSTGARKPAPRIAVIGEHYAIRIGDTQRRQHDVINDGE